MAISVVLLDVSDDGSFPSKREHCLCIIASQRDKHIGANCSRNTQLEHIIRIDEVLLGQGPDIPIPRGITAVMRTSRRERYI